MSHVKNWTYFASILKFVKESWLIEGEHLSTQDAGHIADLHIEFARLKHLEVGDLVRLALSFTGNRGKLRDKLGMDVVVGTHVAPRGGPEIPVQLACLLADGIDHRLDPYDLHQAFENLHPFMDGNGRTGRALWLWSMGGQAPLGFLHAWYYQSLEHADIRKKDSAQ